jgi:hypothetical protein
MQKYFETIHEGFFLIIRYLKKNIMMLQKDFNVRCHSWLRLWSKNYVAMQ